MDKRFAYNQLVVVVVSVFDTFHYTIYSLWLELSCVRSIYVLKIEVQRDFDIKGKHIKILQFWEWSK